MPISKNNLMITSYGIDSALSQILYYHHTGSTNFITLGRAKALEEASFLHPSILINLFELDNAVSFNRSSTLSATNQLATYLNVDKSIMKYAVLSDKILSYDEELEPVVNFYEAVGHDNFVNRFIITDSLTLTKSEIALGKAYVIEFQKIAKEYVDNFLFYKDGIAIIKSNFKLGKYLEEAIIDKYAEDGLKLVATYSYSDSATLRFKAKKDIKEKLINNIDPAYLVETEFGYEVRMSINNEDIEYCFYEELSKAWDKMVEDDKKKVFDEYDKKVKELDYT